MTITGVNPSGLNEERRSGHYCFSALARKLRPLVAPDAGGPLVYKPRYVMAAMFIMDFLTRALKQAVPTDRFHPPGVINNISSPPKSSVHMGHVKAPSYLDMKPRASPFSRIQLSPRGEFFNARQSPVSLFIRLAQLWQSAFNTRVSLLSSS